MTDNEMGRPGFDPSGDEYDDYEELDENAEWCDRCQGMGIANCYCGGDQCYCENYGEMECPQCGGEGHFVPTEAFKAAREQNAKWWREFWAKQTSDSAAIAQPSIAKTSVSEG